MDDRVGLISAGKQARPHSRIDRDRHLAMMLFCHYPHLNQSFMQRSRGAGEKDGKQLVAFLMGY